MRPRAPVLPAEQASALGLRMAEAARNQDTATVRSLLEQGADPNRPSQDGTPAALWATHHSDAATLKLLIDYGADVNRANRYGLTALHLASNQGEDELAEILLRAGAKPGTPDERGETPLMMAARGGSAAIVDMLLDAGAAVDASDKVHNVTPLMLAGWYAHPEVTRRLLAAKAKIDARTTLGPVPKFTPPGFGNGSHGDGIVRGGVPPQGQRAAAPGGMTALLYAARGGDLESVRMLVDAGASIEQGEANAVRPLLMAILNNRMDIATFLIGKGANVNAADFYGRAPLWSAVEMRNVEYPSDTSGEHDVDRPAVLKVIELLLQKGADPNARLKEYPPTRNFLMQGGSLSWVDFTGQTPFLRAALSGDVTVMKLLIKYRADPNIATLRGTTPLMAAAGVNWVYYQTYDEGEDQLIEAIKLCMKYGQDVNAANSMKVTALHGAANRGADKILRFLVDHGGRLEDADDQGRTALSWAHGVFLATLPAVAKPSTIALIEQLCAARGLQCEGSKAPVKTGPGRTAGGASSGGLVRPGGLGGLGGAKPVNAIVRPGQQQRGRAKRR
ncbi:ankyrin repeat domain-containing protein [Sphingobium nicotianae]|nr:ankyrin repeat domain-containing protein [Sphingobium nicotianae]